MNIFFVLALNLLSFTVIASLVKEHGIPSDKTQSLLLLLFAITSLCNMYYIVAKAMKKSDDKTPISGTFFPNHDAD